MLEDDVCAEKHKRVDERLEQHEIIMKEHDSKIDVLSISDATNTAVISNLCDQLSSQTKAIWGLVSMVAVSLLGFFFTIVQNGVIK